MLIYAFVKKNIDPLINDSFTDMQRLREAFFSTPKKELPAKKKFSNPRFYTIAGLGLILITTAFLIKYDIFIIARQNIEKEKNSVSLLTEKMLAGVDFLDRKTSITKKPSSIYLPLFGQKKVGVKIDLAKPVDLNNNYLWVYIKKSETPMKLNIVTRDIHFFSNALTPLVIDMNEKDNSSYLRIPLIPENFSSPKVNLTQVNQIRLYFNTQQTSPDKSRNPFSYEKNWVLIKDLVLIKKPK